MQNSLAIYICYIWVFFILYILEFETPYANVVNWMEITYLKKKNDVEIFQNWHWKLQNVKHVRDFSNSYSCTLLAFIAQWFQYKIHLYL